MAKQEALQKFASHVDLSGVMDDFPEIDWVVTELDDGQQEIVIRLQGIDVDFHPAGDLAAIDATLVAGDDFEVKNNITLQRYKKQARQERINRRDNAWLKRINGMRIEMGMSVKRCVRLIESKMPVRVKEDV
jgi:hypothetical protein